MATLQEFLRAVQPAQGIKVVSGLPPREPGVKKGRIFNKGFRTFEEEEVKIRETAGNVGLNTQIALSGFSEDGWKGQGNDFSRTAINAKWERSLWIDIDCGEKKDYPSQYEGMKAFRKFLIELGFDFTPTFIINSGNGWHIYWCFTEDVPNKDWSKAAFNLKGIAAELHFKIDDDVTTNGAQLLRPIGTINRKPGWKEVTIEEENNVFYSFPELSEKLNKRAKELGVDKDTTRTYSRDFKGEDDKYIYLARKLIPQIYPFQFAIKRPTEVDEPRWHAIGNLCSFCEDGREVFLELSAYDPNQFNEAEANEKFNTISKSARHPVSYGYLHDLFGGDVLLDKKASKDVKSTSTPLVYAREPKPKAASIIGVDPPYPYCRQANGNGNICVYKQSKGQDGEPNLTLVLDGDMYPCLETLKDNSGNETDIFMVKLNGLHKDYIALNVVGELLNDETKMRKPLTSCSIRGTNKDFRAILEYMQTYAKAIQGYRTKVLQPKQLGWANSESGLKKADDRNRIFPWRYDVIKGG